MCTQGSPEGVRVKIDCSALPEIFVCWQRNSFQEVQKSVRRAINSVCVGFEYVVKYWIRLSDTTSEKLVCTIEYIN